MTGREKMLRYDRKKETLWHGRREKKCRLGQERINSKIPGRLLRNRGMTLLGETIMGGAEYYQKIPLVFSLICINLAFASG